MSRFRSLTLIDTRYQQNNIRAPARLTQQVRYIGRAGDVELFDRFLAPTPPTDARSLIASHGLAPAWTGPVAYHRVILSLRADAVPVPAVPGLLTIVLDDLGLLLDRRPVWVAGVHRDTDNTHTHVLLAGGDAEGRSTEIRGRALERWKRQVEERARHVSE